MHIPRTSQNLLKSSNTSTSSICGIILTTTTTVLSTLNARSSHSYHLLLDITALHSGNTTAKAIILPSISINYSFPTPLASLSPIFLITTAALLTGSAAGAPPRLLCTCAYPTVLLIEWSSRRARISPSPSRPPARPVPLRIPVKRLHLSKLLILQCDCGCVMKGY